MKREQLIKFFIFFINFLLFMQKSSYFVFGLTYHTINVDGDLSDWDFSSEQTIGSDGSYHYYTWDAEYLYFAVNHSSITYNNDVAYLAYFDTDPQQNPLSGNGYAIGNPFGHQTAYLPFNADFHLFWKFNFLPVVCNVFVPVQLNTNSWYWEDINRVLPTPIDLNCAHKSSINALEISIPRSNLTNNGLLDPYPNQMYIVGAIVDKTPGNESTFAFSPKLNHTRGFYNQTYFYGFYSQVLTSGIAPNLPYHINNYVTASIVNGQFTDSSSWQGAQVPDANTFAYIKHAITLNMVSPTQNLVGVIVLQDGNFQITSDSKIQFSSTSCFIGNQGTFQSDGVIAFYDCVIDSITGTTIRDINLKGSLDFGRKTLLTGTLSLFGSNAKIVNNPPSYAPTSILNYEGGTYTRGVEWDINNSPYSVSLISDASLDMGTSSSPLRMLGSLTVTLGSYFTEYSFNSSLYIGGNLNNDGFIQVSSTEDIFVGGSVVNTHVIMCSNGHTVRSGSSNIPWNKPVITASGNTTFPLGGNVTLDAGVPCCGLKETYLWSTGETTRTILVTSTGSYFVTITDSNNCAATSDSVNVTAIPPPVTTQKQTTAEQTTAEKTTAERTTAQFTTAQFTTAKRTTAQFTTAQFTTAERTTAQFTTAQFTTAKFTTAERTTVEHTTVERTTAEHTTSAYTTGELTTAAFTTSHSEPEQDSSTTIKAIIIPIASVIGIILLLIPLVFILRKKKKMKEEEKELLKAIF